MSRSVLFEVLLIIVWRRFLPHFPSKSRCIGKIALMGVGSVLAALAEQRVCSPLWFVANRIALRCDVWRCFVVGGMFSSCVFGMCPCIVLCGIVKRRRGALRQL